MAGAEAHPASSPPVTPRVTSQPLNRQQLEDHTSDSTVLRPGPCRSPCEVPPGLGDRGDHRRHFSPTPAPMPLTSADRAEGRARGPVPSSPACPGWPVPAVLSPGPQPLPVGGPRRAAQGSQAQGLQGALTGSPRWPPSKRPCPRSGPGHRPCARTSTCKSKRAPGRPQPPGRTTESSLQLPSGPSRPPSQRP